MKLVTDLAGDPEGTCGISSKEAAFLRRRLRKYGDRRDGPAHPRGVAEARPGDQCRTGGAGEPVTLGLPPAGAAPAGGWAHSRVQFTSKRPQVRPARDRPLSDHALAPRRTS